MYLNIHQLVGACPTLHLHVESKREISPHPPMCDARVVKIQIISKCLVLIRCYMLLILSIRKYTWVEYFENFDSWFVKDYI